MANICLPPKIAEKFQQAFRDNKINPEKLMNMTSEERHNFFKKFSDKDSATTINSLFESKLLLKNQQKGIISWAKTVSGISEPARRDLISRISRMDRVLDPAEKEAFLKDLAETKLGVGVSREESQKIAGLSQKIEELRGKRNADGTWTNREDGLNFGRNIYDLEQYVGELKNGAKKFKFSDLKGFGAVRSIPHLAKAVNDISKSLGASLDDSFAVRQGIKTIFTDFPQWQKEFRKSFVNLVKGAKNPELAKRELFANRVVDPDYEAAVKGGLFKQDQDVFPTSAPEKIPIAGRAFSASEVAFSGYSDDLKFAIFKKYLRRAEKQGINTNDKEFLEHLSKMSKSMGGQGTFKGAEHIASKMAPAFYSLRFLKSNIDTLLLHPLGIGVGGFMKGGFVQRQAAKNLAKIVLGIATVLEVSNQIKPGSVDFDPRSSDFGKIKIGSTRFDVTGGMGSLLTLAARLATQSSKSSTTHQVTPLNSGKYGAQTEYDTILSFFSNKLSPSAGVIRDKLKGKDPQGNKFYVGNEAKTLVTPLGIKNYQELKQNEKNQGNDKSANILFSIIADGLGISTNSYTSSNASTDWNNNTGKELTQFKNAVGATKFKAANQQYNDKLGNWQSSMAKSPAFQKLSATAQKTVQTKEEDKLKTDIFKQNGFKYKAAKTPKNQYSEFLQ